MALKKWNKKGIMVKFLTSLLLAIIVFAPACMIGSKFFRTSTQALDNYGEFVTKIQKFAGESEIGEPGSTLMIIDEETAIVYFNGSSDTSQVTLEVDSAYYLSDYTVNFVRPAQCESEGSCICLFRSNNVAVESTTVTVTGDRVDCSLLDFDLDIETCIYGEGSSINSYTCSGGFVIERTLLKEMLDDENWVFDGAYYELSRRTMVYLTRLDTAVRLRVGKYETT